jgi:hypothetical protein
VIRDSEAARAERSSSSGGAVDALLGESRWPPVAAIVVFMAFNVALRVWLPGEGAVRVPWLLPAIEGVLLVVLLSGNPSGPVERHRLRRGALVLVGLLVVAALWATALLIDDLIRGKGVSNSASELLASGAVVWLGNNLAFALLYWLMDGGGANARTRQRNPSTSRSRSTSAPNSPRPAGGPSFSTTCTSASRTRPPLAPPT